MVLPTKDVPFTGRGGSPLAHLSAWVKTRCPSCGGPAQRETDTMDTFMDSSWYFFRFADPHNQTLPAAPEAIQSWLPVDAYVGGIEHAIMHLLYARFISIFLTDELGLQGQGEPFDALITQGLVEGLTYRCPSTGRYLCPGEYTVDPRDPTKAIMMVDASEVQAQVSWEKMSKSKYNGVDPLDLVQIYGADTLRLCVLFKAPPEVPLGWNTRDIAGPQRWLVRLLNLAERIRDQAAASSPGDPTTSRQLTLVLERAILDMERAYDPVKHRLNLAVSTLMKLSNDIERHFSADRQVLLDAMNSLALLLHPIAPHSAAEIRAIIGNVDVWSWPASRGSSVNLN